MEIEQRAVMKFHAKLGTSAAKTYEMMQQVYGDDCLSKSRVFGWHKEFREGRESIEGPKRRTCRTPESIQKVRDILADDPNATARVIAEKLNISATTAQTIIVEIVGKRKVCAHGVVDHETKQNPKRYFVFFLQKPN